MDGRSVVASRLRSLLFQPLIVKDGLFNYHEYYCLLHIEIILPYDSIPLLKLLLRPTDTIVTTTATTAAKLI